MKFEVSRQRITSFTAASLTDIVLLLLIFFLLSSSFVVQPGIKVQLPKATSAPVETEGRIYLTLTADGKIFLNDEQLRKNDLGEKIHRQLRASRDQVVVIRADERLTLGKTIEIIDIVKVAGAERFLIATSPGVMN